MALTDLDLASDGVEFKYWCCAKGRLAFLFPKRHCCSLFVCVLRTIIFSSIPRRLSGCLYSFVATHQPTVRQRLFQPLRLFPFRQPTGRSFAPRDLSLLSSNPPMSAQAKVKAQAERNKKLDMLASSSSESPAETSNAKKKDIRLANKAFVNPTPEGDKKEVSGSLAEAYDPPAVEAAWYAWREKQRSEEH